MPKAPRHFCNGRLGLNLEGGIRMLWAAFIYVENSTYSQYNKSKVGWDYVNKVYD